MTVDGTEVADSQIFEKLSRSDGILYGFFDALQKRTEMAPDDSRNLLHHPVDVRTELVVLRIGNQAVQVLGKSADIGCNAHLVIVQDDGHVLLGKSRIVERFKRHTARHGTVTDDCDDAVVLVKFVPGYGKA